MANKVLTILAGLPQQMAMDVAIACKKRGFQIATTGIGLENAPEYVEIPQVGKISIVKASSPEILTKLQQQVDEGRKQGLFPIVADTTQSDSNVKLYNQLKLPFVMQTKGGNSHMKAVADTEAAKTFALITQDMNKRMAAFDAMWQDWSARFPSLFDGWDLSIKSTNPPQARPKSLLSSMSNFFGRDLRQQEIQQMDSATAGKPAVEGSYTNDYTFSNGSGTSSISFRQTFDNEKEYAEGVADSVGFLAQKAQQAIAPRVYNILDVAEHGALTW